MATAFKFIPVTSAWASPTLEKMGAAVECEMSRYANAQSDRAQDIHAELSKAFDLICEADKALAEAGWAA